MKEVLQSNHERAFALVVVGRLHGAQLPRRRELLTSLVTEWQWEQSMANQQTINV